MQLRLPDSVIALTGRAKVMGVLNVTPDSFSDGGEFLDASDALARARAMIADGADLIDVGGESTRPGADPVPPPEQIRRVFPVIERLRQADPAVPISIDTRSAAVAEAAIDAGANLINDVAALRDDPEMAPLAAERNVPVVLMHMKGNPRTMQVNPTYEDVVAEVRDFLVERIEAARSAGIAPDRIVVDPGLGFGKGARDNFELVRGVEAFGSLGVPVLLGPSRKRFIGEALGVDVPAERMFGTAAVVAFAVQRGVRIVRVHDVREMRHVVEILHAINTAGENYP